MVKNLEYEVDSISGPPPLCMRCAHFNGGDLIKNSCKAFPDEIPFDIIMGDFDHRDPYPGDNGIQFLDWRISEGLMVPGESSQEED